MSTDAAADFVARVRSARLRASVDAVTAEVVRALQADGVRALLLKGPVLVALLYGDDSTRSYLDADLLVAPPDHARAARCLTRLGFEEALAGSDVPGSDVAGDTWRRPGGEPAVDLHSTLPGVGATPARLWDALSEATDVLPVGGVTVEVPRVPGRALIVALHAAHHGAAVDHPLEDLARALERLDAAAWAEAAQLARRVDAADAFAAGLTLHPAGRAIAERLGLPSRPPLELALRRGHAPPGAVTLAVLASTEGVLARLRVVARKVVPTRRFMRFWYPRAAGGSGWLAVGYLWRPVWLVLRARPAVAALRRARNSDASSPTSR
jgi:hypothetical protein